MTQAKAKTKPAKRKAAAGPKKLDVVCPQCRGVFHETTETYDPERVPNTSMCRLKEPYHSWGWEDFYSAPGEGSGNMECPGCGAPYVTVNMRLETRTQTAGGSK